MHIKEYHLQQIVLAYSQQNVCLSTPYLYLVNHLQDKANILFYQMEILYNRFLIQNQHRYPYTMVLQEMHQNMLFVFLLPILQLENHQDTLNITSNNLPHREVSSSSILWLAFLYQRKKVC